MTNEVLIEAVGPDRPVGEESPPVWNILTSDTKISKYHATDDCKDMPFNWRITDGLRPESTVVLAGLIPEQSKRFYIQLANGQYERAKALRLEAEFNDSPYVAIVTLNCVETRPRIKESPLKPGKRFTIKINVTRNSYKVFANGRFLDEFPHCFPPKDAVFLEMDGDVMLEELKFLPPNPAGH
ncbi:UNVERIFIED_CONTAM: hypothetical protein K2H54_035186 [Gekko kuhli]